MTTPTTRHRSTTPWQVVEARFLGALPPTVPLAASRPEGAGASRRLSSEGPDTSVSSSTPMLTRSRSAPRTRPANGMSRAAVDLLSREALDRPHLSNRASLGSNSGSPILSPLSPHGSKPPTSDTKQHEARVTEARHLLTATDGDVVCEGAVDLEDFAPAGRRHGVSWQMHEAKQWRGRHLTLLSDGTLCVSPQSRRELQARSRAAALSSPRVSPRAGDSGVGATAFRVPLQGALCVAGGCTAPVRRPHGFCVRSRRRDYHFACAVKEDAVAWISAITDAIAAIEQTGEQHHSSGHTDHHIHAALAKLNLDSSNLYFQLQRWLL